MLLLRLPRRAPRPRLPLSRLASTNSAAVSAAQQQQQHQRQQRSSKSATATTTTTTTTTTTAALDALSSLETLARDRGLPWTTANAARREGLARIEARPGHVALEVGFGGGVGLAALARVVVGAGRTEAQGQGQVFGVDRDPTRVEDATAALRKVLAEREQAAVVVVPLDGVSEHAPGAPFDRVLVSFALPGVACPEVDLLLSQLKVGGRLVAPVHLTKTETWLAVYDKGKNGALMTNLAVKLPSDRVPKREHGLARNETPGAPEPPARRRRAELKAKLLEWTVAFEKKHGRKPTRVDMSAHADAGAWFAEFTSLPDV